MSNQNLEVSFTLENLAAELRRQGWNQYYVSDTPFSPEGSWFYFALPNPGYEDDGRHLVLHPEGGTESLSAADWEHFRLVVMEHAITKHVIGLTVEDVHAELTWAALSWNGLAHSILWAEKIVKAVKRFWDEELYLAEDSAWRPPGL